MARPIKSHRIVHPITEALRQRRLLRRIGLTEMGRLVGTSRGSIEHHENTKFQGLSMLDRWARALGYQLVLLDMEPAKPTKLERIVSRAALQECEQWIGR